MRGIVIHNVGMSNQLDTIDQESAMSCVAKNELIPSVDGLGAYIRFAKNQPMLTEEEEQDLALKLQQKNDLEAAKRLILSHLRVVIKIANEHKGYGLPQEDLIQEGNIGLMKAVRRFEPGKGARLVSYASLWIKAEIQEFILSNWRLVKIGAGKGLKKLFFNLRKLQATLHGRSRLEQKEEIMKTLGVSAEEFDRAQEWFAGDAVSLDETMPEGGSPLSLPAPTKTIPEQALSEQQANEWKARAAQDALGALNDRERQVITARLLQEKSKTLSELADQLNVSVERVRQIEVAALKKMKTELERHGVGAARARIELHENDA